MMNSRERDTSDRGGREPVRIGVLGTGRIAAALVTGLCSAGGPSCSVLVSPRNAEVATGLANRFNQVSVAPDNQALLDGSDWVFLTLRPPMAHDVLSRLRFRSDHCVVSIMAMVQLDALKTLAAPASSVVRALTLPSVSGRTGPILLCPADEDTERFLTPLGAPLPMGDERQLEVLWAMTAMIAPFYALVERSAVWAEGHGVESGAARDYAAGFFRSIVQALDGVHDMAPLIAEAQTPGGLNEQALRTLTDAGWFEALTPVLDAILARLTDA